MSTENQPPLVGALAEPIAVLSADPYNLSGEHPISKLVNVKQGEGRWRIRWRNYRLRCDIAGHEVILHAFRHRKDAY